MLRFLHAADFHLDSPFAALGGEKAALRRQEQRRQLRELADLAEGTDLVLLAGDLLDSVRAYGETREALQEFFRCLPMPVFIAPGNHDSYIPQSPYTRMGLPENVCVSFLLDVGYPAEGSVNHHTPRKAIGEMVVEL